MPGEGSKDEYTRSFGNLDESRILSTIEEAMFQAKTIQSLLVDLYDPEDKIEEASSSDNTSIEVFGIYLLDLKGASSIIKSILLRALGVSPEIKVVALAGAV